ncbi:hypothetical protein [Parasediminibacterium sp. JCM 36343]|uniref:hypothetical protein n=1 Tax=Parasediminibacterium sp. JCM 36343 TaxID=3374279 RepID=UPI00397A4522
MAMQDIRLARFFIETILEEPVLEITPSLQEETFLKEYSKSADLAIAKALMEKKGRAGYHCRVQAGLYRYHQTGRRKK